MPGTTSTALPPFLTKQMQPNGRGGHSRWNDTISCRYALSRLERYFWFLVYFLNNSIKNQPILIILAQNNLKKTDTGKILKCAHFSYKPLSHYLGKCKK